MVWLIYTNFTPIQRLIGKDSHCSHVWAAAVSLFVPAHFEVRDIPLKQFDLQHKSYVLILSQRP